MEMLREKEGGKWNYRVSWVEEGSQQWSGDRRECNQYPEQAISSLGDTDFEAQSVGHYVDRYCLLQ